MSSHNICFCEEIRKLSVLFHRNKSTLSGVIVIKIFLNQNKYCRYSGQGDSSEYSQEI